jgi:hypothetical protein
MYTRLTRHGWIVSLALGKASMWIGGIMLGLWCVTALGGTLAEWMRKNPTSSPAAYLPPQRVYLLPPPIAINNPPPATWFSVNGPSPLKFAPAPQHLVPVYNMFDPSQTVPQNRVLTGTSFSHPCRISPIQVDLTGWRRCYQRRNVIYITNFRYPTNFRSGYHAYSVGKR